MKRSSISLIVCLICSFIVGVTFILPEAVHAGGDYSYEYKFVKGSWKTKKTKWIDAGGQNPGGTRFDTGKGGFYWADDGGPTGSVSFGASAGFASFSVSVAMGKKASTGEWVAVPGKPSEVKKHYYKLKIKKEIKARPIKMYKRLKKKDAKWQFVSQSTEKKVISHDLGVRKVK